MLNLSEPRFTVLATQNGCAQATDVQKRQAHTFSNGVGTLIQGHDLQDIMDGATFLAVGGGGPKDFGKKLLQALDGCSIPMIDVSQVDDNDWGVVSAYLGSPLAAAALKTPTFDSLHRSIDALQRSTGHTVKFIVPGEMGAVNTIAPFLAAHDVGVPLVDADGCGRAVPVLGATSFGGDETLIPRAGAAVANDTDDKKDYQSAVLSAGSIGQIQSAAGAVLGSPAYGKLGAVAVWMMTGAELKKLAVCGGVSRAQSIGRALREACSSNTSALEALEKTLADLNIAARVLFNGSTLTSVSAQISTHNIHDHGTLTFKVTDKPHETISVYTFNENVLAYSSQQTAPVLLSPDMLCWMLPDGRTLDNSELQSRIQKASGSIEVYAVGVEANQLIGAPGNSDRVAFRDAKNIRDEMAVVLSHAGYSGEYTHFKA